ncbi:MAG: TIGR00289 family protein [Candidatus Aenigmarchaeota archaeon]|nr:TIGR00289 family protein [Candidatus Aenigmarchaeota archaeon]
MKLAALFSGGKDSTFAVYKMIKEGHEVKYLITLFPKRFDSWMFHVPCIEMTKVQSQLMGINHLFRESSGEKEEELKDLEKIIEEIKDEIEGIVSGTIESRYQKSRIDKICDKFRLISIATLWHKDPEELLREELKEGFEILVVSASSEGLDRSWIGRKIDEKAIEELKKIREDFGLHLAGEGGEFETLVLDCPLFSKKIKIKDFDVIWNKEENSGYMKIKDFELLPKV